MALNFLNTMKIIEYKNVLKQDDKKKQHDEYVIRQGLPPRDEDLRSLLKKPMRR